LTGLAYVATIVASPTAVAQPDVPVSPAVQADGGVVNVKDFGAKCDGSTDDTPALNAALNYARAHTVAGQIVARVVFSPAGVCRHTGTLNFTGLRNFPTEIDGGGSVLDCEVSGGPCVDALYTRYLHIRNLTITANGPAVPTIGLQLGLINATVVSDCNEIDNLTASGHFSITAVYNRSSETTLWNHLLAWNSYSGGAAYDLVMDGYNHWNVQSAFQIVTLQRDVANSFNENTFITPDFRRVGPGAAVWSGFTSRHAYIGGYIGNSAVGEVTNYGMVLYGYNGFLNADIHGEAFGYLTDMFYVTAPSGTTSTIIDGLRFRDHNSQANSAIFRLDAALTGGVALTNADIEIGGLRASKVFDGPSRWMVSGNYKLPAGFSAWNLPAVQFNGIGTIGTVASFYGNSNGLHITPTTPATSSSACVVGQISADANYIYLCTATNSWKRTALGAW